MKICSKCGVEKDATEFSRKGTGLQPYCKACDKACNKAYRQANREKRLEYQKAYRQANREKKAEQEKAWRQANREKKAEQNKAWDQANPEKRRAIKQRRRARKAGAAGSHTIEQWEGRLDYFDNTCVYCGATGEMQKEHQIPLSRGGTDWPANLVPACPSCNYRKGTKTPREFLDSHQPRSRIECNNSLHTEAL